MNARLGKEAMGRLVLEASTGMHGAVAKQIALELTAALEAQQAVSKPDGRLHADGYFTWNKGKRPAYIADSGLPCDFYLHPAPVQQMDALTDAQIDACWDGPTPSGSGKSRYDIARAIIRAALAAQPAAEREVPFISADTITVNLMRLAGLDKHKARECEQIVRQVLAAQRDERLTSGKDKQ